MSDDKIDVLGIGNAIVDVLVHTDDAFLERSGLAKGVMTLIDADEAQRLYAEMKDGIECSGGSAANSIAGLASLGGRGAYIGKVRDDSLGATFRRDIGKAGVTFDTPAAPDGPPTARCLIFVTDDAQRTMQTFLGASATLAPGDIDAGTVRNARITYLEGYLFDPPPAQQAFRRAAEIAHGAGRRVALTLSDPFCVDRHRDEFRELVQNHVDIVFANEEEARSLFQVETTEEAAAALRGTCEIAVITRGAAGSLVLTRDEAIEIEPEPVAKVVDTTGAGDLYAAGFLFGLSTRRDPRTCGRLGGIAAAEIISHYGARPTTSLKELAGVRLA